MIGLFIDYKIACAFHDNFLYGSAVEVLVVVVMVGLDFIMLCTLTKLDRNSKKFSMLL